MDYNSLSSYKNYLPSKKIQLVIGILLLAAVIYIIVPPLARAIRNRKTSSGPTPTVTLGLPTGNPTTRDSSGQGIPDWELLAVGINPTSPNAVASFEKIKDKMTATAINNLENQTTDTDKISLTTGNVLNQDASANQGITGDNVDQATESEILNYVSSIEAQNTVYSLSDLTTVDSTLANATAYQQGIKNISFVDLTSSTVWQHISGYIQGTEDETATNAILTQMQESLASMKTLPIPEPIAQNYLDAFNALSGFYQTLNAYDQTKSTDQVYPFGTVGALQDYVHNFVLAEGEVNLYLSVAMDPKNYETP